MNTMLDPFEFEEFNCDVKRIEWKRYTDNYCKGMMIWALKEDKISPEYNMDQLLLKKATLC